MSGANRPAGPATPKSKALEKLISRDEMEHNLPDALRGDADLDTEFDDGSTSQQRPSLDNDKR
jgi:hypothetical protein